MPLSKKSGPGDYPAVASLSLDIERARVRIGREIDRLGRHGPDRKPRNTRLTASNRAITGGNFEVAGRAVDYERIEVIDTAADDLVETLRDDLDIV